MANKQPFTITIESILGGHSPTSHFAGGGQFRASLGIDPAQPIDDLDTNFSTVASGLLRPSASEKFSGTVINAAPLWMITTPKDSNMYVYDALGSVYTVNATFTTVTGISDGGGLSNSKGNGSEYYDNYMYFAKNTTVARYGPLNGAAVLNSDYWVTTLGKTSLVDTTYPGSFKNDILLPNHVMKRHSDGILYITDVVGNQGYLHTIETSKTTVEGDTDAGSTYLKLGFGYGLWPTALESWGESLAIALYEGSNTGLRQKNAKIGFWDTTSTNIEKITWLEFPDAIITAMKNVNGVLYVVSGNYKTRGFRITRFLGGYSFEEAYYSEVGEPCLPGAIDAVLNRCVFGSHTNVPESDGCLNSIGLQKGNLTNGLFNVMRSTGGDASTTVTAVAFADAGGMGFYTPVIGWTKGSGTSNNGLDKQGTTYSNAPSVFWSAMYRIGRKFKITKITIPVSQNIIAGMTLIPKIYFDDGTLSKTQQTINSTNYPNFSHVVIRPEDASGRFNFWLELRWTGANLLTVNLPITIEGESYDE